MSISVTADLVKLARDEGTIEGVALACAELVRLFDQPSMAYEIMKSHGVTSRKAKAVGLEEFDLRELRKAERQR